MWRCKYHCKQNIVWWFNTTELQPTSITLELPQNIHTSCCGTNVTVPFQPHNGMASTLAIHYQAQVLYCVLYVDVSDNMQLATFRKVREQATTLDHGHAGILRDDFLEFLENNNNHQSCGN